MFFVSGIIAFVIGATVLKNTHPYRVTLADKLAGFPLVIGGAASVVFSVGAALWKIMP